MMSLPTDKVQALAKKGTPAALPPKTAKLSGHDFSRIPFGEGPAL